MKRRNGAVQESRREKRPNRDGPVGGAPGHAVRCRSAAQRGFRAASLQRRSRPGRPALHALHPTRLNYNESQHWVERSRAHGPASAAVWTLCSPARGLVNTAASSAQVGNCHSQRENVTAGARQKGWEAGQGCGCLAGPFGAGTAPKSCTTGVAEPSTSAGFTRRRPCTPWLRGRRFRNTQRVPAPADLRTAPRGKTVQACRVNNDADEEGARPGAWTCLPCETPLCTTGFQDRMRRWSMVVICQARG